jgi:hypothetical protein
MIHRISLFIPIFVIVRPNNALVQDMMAAVFFTGGFILTAGVPRSKLSI